MPLTDWIPKVVRDRLPGLPEPTKNKQKVLNLTSAVMTLVGGIGNFAKVEPLVLIAPLLNAASRTAGLAMQHAVDVKDEAAKSTQNGRLAAVQAAITTKNVAASSTEPTLRMPESTSALLAPQPDELLSAKDVRKAIQFNHGDKQGFAIEADSLPVYRIYDADDFEKQRAGAEEREKSAAAQLRAQAEKAEQHRLTELGNYSPGITKNDLKRVDDAVTKWNSNHPKMEPLPELREVRLIANPDKEIAGRILRLETPGDPSKGTADHSHAALTAANDGVYGILSSKRDHEYIQKWEAREQRNAEMMAGRTQAFTENGTKKDDLLNAVTEAVKKYNAGLTGGRPLKEPTKQSQISITQAAAGKDPSSEANDTYRNGKVFPLGDDTSRKVQNLGGGSYRVLTADQANSLKWTNHNQNQRDRGRAALSR